MQVNLAGILQWVLDQINAKVPSLGTAAMAGSSPVTVATDDTVVTTRFPAGANPADGTANDQSATTIRSRMISYNGTTWDRVRSGISGGTISSLIGWLNTLPGAQYLSAPGVMANTQWTTLQASVNRNLQTNVAEYLAGEDLTNNVLWTAQNPITGASNALTYTDTLNGNGQVAKASAGNLAMLHGTCVTSRYIQIHNATAAPADGAVPLVSMYVPANTNYSIDLSPFKRYFSTGIYVCASSTHATKTLSATGDTDIHTGVA